MSNFNTNGKFDVNKWIEFMNTAIKNIDETLPTKNLQDTLLWGNMLNYNLSIFDNGWIATTFFHLEHFEISKVLMKCDPSQYIKEVEKYPNNKQAHFLLKKFTKFAIYYPETNKVREIDMSEYADLGLKKYIIKAMT